MFAIQSGSKFIKLKHYIDPDKIWDFTVSSEPEKYRTQAEAKLWADRFIKFLDGEIQWKEKSIAETNKSVERAKRDLVRLQAQLDEMVRQPYKDVAQKVRALERKIANAGSAARHKGVPSFRQELGRMVKVRNAGVAVVKVRQTVEAL